MALLLPVFIFGGFFFFAPHASAAIVSCGIQNPLECQLCHLTSLINNIITFLLYIGTSIAALLFAYAGFLYFTSGGSEENVGKAKTIFKDVLIGFIIALCAWLIIDTLLRTLANGKFSGPNLGKIQCVQTGGEGGRQINPDGSSNTNAVGLVGPVSTTVLTGDCVTGDLPQPSGGGWTTQQHQTMSCIAQNESGCSPSAQYSGSANSNATGLYQIIIGGYDDPGHNLNFPSCSAAVGASGNLNCYQAWVAGGKQPRSPQLETCFQAAKDRQCNTDAAAYLLKNGGYSHWTGSGDFNGRNGSCVQRFGS